jgi:hypothetical protein
MALRNVGPYSPQAYQAAEMIQKGGSGTPFSPTVLQAANEIIAKQNPQQSAPVRRTAPASGGGGADPIARERSATEAYLAHHHISLTLKNLPSFSEFNSFAFIFH